MSIPNLFYEIIIKPNVTYDDPTPQSLVDYLLLDSSLTRFKTLLPEFDSVVSVTTRQIR